MSGFDPAKDLALMAKGFQEHVKTVENKQRVGCTSSSPGKKSLLLRGSTANNYLAKFIIVKLMHMLSPLILSTQLDFWMTLGWRSLYN
jgi:hypothetical protein